MKRHIKVASESVSLKEIKDLLESRSNWNDIGVTLFIKEPEIRLRSGFDPAVIIAVIEAASIGLTALITGLIQVTKKYPGKKIVMKAKNGAMLEIPADTPLEDIDKLLLKVKKLDLDEILIS